MKPVVVACLVVAVCVALGGVGVGLLWRDRQRSGTASEAARNRTPAPMEFHSPQSYALYEGGRPVECFDFDTGIVTAEDMDEVTLDALIARAAPGMTRLPASCVERFPDVAIESVIRSELILTTNAGDALPIAWRSTHFAPAAAEPAAAPGRSAPIAERIAYRFPQHNCHLDARCGSMLGIDCGSAADGPYYYVHAQTLEVVAACGGFCMDGDCPNCPPRGWTFH